MREGFRYIKEIFTGCYRLLQGMYITLLNMLRPKVTQQYPENRGKKVYPERFRGLLTMPHNEQNQHKCTACGICMINCPNGTIEVINKTVETKIDTVTPEGETKTIVKTKKVLDRYVYDLGSCTFCALCTSSCPQDAIEWSNVFEHSVFTRDRLYKQLNMEGSELVIKNKE
ncbi:MAG: 4Fe-4S binding protein [Prevotellaceae bacterium]|jgi:NADH-quinone oxidoreductase subunit I|nr:4Fe-4S binding protein [Prevotellaceae bacterium]